MQPRCSRALAALVATTLAGCGTLSVPEERRVGEEVNRQVQEQADLVRDDVIAGYVRDMGHRIVAAVEEPLFTYRFYVIEADQINAFALPAGYIYVHTETILRAANAAELAGVLGHEVGHVVERHVAENYNRARGVSIGHQLAVITAAILGGTVAAQAVDLGGGLAAMAYLNQFTREAEREADAFAVEVLPRAGYDPRGLVTFFETLMRESGGREPPAFLSSHPTTRERIDSVQALIDAADLPPGLRVHDGGRLETVQRRIRRLRGE